MIYTYNGNEKETYYIFKSGKLIAEIFADEDTVIEITSILNKQYVKETNY